MVFPVSPTLHSGQYLPIRGRLSQLIYTRSLANSSPTCEKMGWNRSGPPSVARARPLQNTAGCEESAESSARGRSPARSGPARTGTSSLTRHPGTCAATATRGTVALPFGCGFAALRRFLRSADSAVRAPVVAAGLPLCLQSFHDGVERRFGLARAIEEQLVIPARPREIIQPAFPVAQIPERDAREGGNQGCAAGSKSNVEATNRPFVICPVTLAWRTALQRPSAAWASPRSSILNPSTK